MAIDVSAAALILWALELLTLPISWVLALGISAAVHEGSHLLVLCIFRIPVISVTVGAFGAKIQTGYQENWQELFSALAGPIGSLMLLGARSWFPQLALCGLVHGCFNLIPLPGFDGGRAIGSIWRIVRNGKENTLAKKRV